MVSIDRNNVSHYKILEKLGEGGMGVVFKAEDTRLKRIVALKFLPQALTDDPQAKGRLILEAQAASSLDHPNICTVYEIDETDGGQLFMAMACYDGESLKKIIEHGALSTDRCIEVSTQIAQGLAKAHESGIIHRDIKPANILITGDGVAKIVDFGLAKLRGRTMLTQAGSTLGTAAYMSPEQARGESVDHRTDIWAMGVVLYEMASGQPPFKSEYEQAMIYSILNSAPDFGVIPPDLQPILRKALAKSPDERYQNVNELLADLVSLRDGGKVSRPGRRLHRKKISPRTRYIVSAGALVSLAVLIYFGARVWADHESVVPERKMIVVLPFENLGTPDDEYFAQGMRQEISNKLAAIASIGVISRSSAEKYARSNKTAKEIGQELGVDYILEGTLQWARNANKSDRIRVIPQLIKVADDVNIWSDSYDRVLNDIFDVQNEIAQNVVDRIGENILSKKIAGVPPTRNLDAYDFYLKALPFHYGPSTGANIKTAAKLYERALALDPSFASAHAQIAIAYGGLFKWRWDSDSLNLKRGVEHLKKAQELNPNLSEVHLAQFFYAAWYGADEERAFQELQKTLELDPNNAEATFHIASFYWRRGDFELGRQYDERSVRLDPLNGRYLWGIGQDYRARRDYATADEYLKRAIRVGPPNSGLYVALAMNYVDWKGNTALASEVLKNVTDEEYLEFSSNIFVYLNLLDRSYGKALQQLRSAKKEYENSPFGYVTNAEMIARVYGYMKNEALSRTYFDSSKMEIARLLGVDPDDMRFHFAASRIYAALGQRRKALEEYETGLRAGTAREGAGWGSGGGGVRRAMRADHLMTMYTLLGEPDSALAYADSLFLWDSLFSVNRLKMDPQYDPLRQHPRYEEIVNKYSNESIR